MDQEHKKLGSFKTGQQTIRPVVIWSLLLTIAIVTSGAYWYLENGQNYTELARFILRTRLQTTNTAGTADAHAGYAHTVLSVEGNHFLIDIADTEALRDQGLSGRKMIGPNEGMLFVFEKPEFYKFWMKEMLFSIDIVWIDQNQRVINCSEHIAPDTYPQTIVPDHPALYVLEVAAGTCKQLDIRKADKVMF